jgi:tape measure domain-containing protein
MANDLDFRIGAELTEIKGALAGLQRDLQKVGQTAQQAGGNNAFQGLERSAGGAVAAVGRLVAGFVTLAGVMKGIATADALNTLNARLKIATKSTDEFTRAQVALFDISQRSRSSLAETVDLYSRIALSTKNAKVGQETLLQVVETINQAVQLSGAGTQAAQYALQQLGQGLGAGTLRGEELNSVLEQTPALADAIAEGMGITRERLKEYGEQGKITSQQVIQALVNQRDIVAKTFAELPLTVGQSITQLGNAALQIVGVFDQSSGATKGLAETISDFAKFLSSDEVAGAVMVFAQTARDAFKLFADAAAFYVDLVVGAVGLYVDLMDATVGRTNAAINEMSDDFLRLPRSSEQAVDLIIRAFRELPQNIRASIQIVTVQAAAMFDRLVSYAQFVKDNFKAIFTDDTQDAAFARFQARNRAIEQAARETVDEALSEREKALTEAQQAREKAQRLREQGRRNTGANGLGTFNTGNKGGTAAQAAQLRKAELDAEEKLLDDAAKRQLRILEEQFEDSKIAAETYYTRRAELELEGVNRAIAIEQQRAAAGGTERVKALAEIELLERRKTDIQTQAARDRATFTANIERQLEQARIAQLEAQGNQVEAAKLRAQAEYDDLLTSLRSEGRTAGVELIENVIGLKIADAKLQELKDKIGAAVSDLRGTESLVAAQVDAGLLPAIQGEEQLQAVRAQGIAQLQEYLSALQAIAAAQSQAGGIVDPRVVESIRQVSTEIARATAAQRTFQNQIQDSGQSALQGLFTDLATGARSFGDAIRAAALSFIQSLARMAAEALAKRAILSLAGLGGPGGFLSALVAHSGAIVGGGGGSMRMVNPLMFAGAPRYHSGGMVGLKPDERPAILQTGEEVLSRSDPRNAANGAGGSGTRIINVIDPSMVSDYLASSSGEKTILNVLQRNPGAVRQVLA